MTSSVICGLSQFNTKTACLPINQLTQTDNCYFVSLSKAIKKIMKSNVKIAFCTWYSTADIIIVCSTIVLPGF